MCDCNEDRIYEYIIYGVLGILLISSEALGLTPSISYNSILEIIVNKLKKHKKEEVNTAEPEVVIRTSSS